MSALFRRGEAGFIREYVAMRDDECVLFLQWALPQLRMRWPGFRKVRGQVCKRVTRRMTELGIDAVTDYRDYLGRHAVEWCVLDNLCQVTISRFYRDKLMYRKNRDRSI